MTPGLPQVPCAAAEPGASGRTGHWAQKQPLLFSFSAAVLPGAVPSVLCSEAAPAHVPGTLRLLKTGVWLRRGDWSGRRRFVTPLWFSIRLLLANKGNWFCSVLPASDSQKKRLRSCPMSLQIDTKNYLGAVAGGKWFPLYKNADILFWKPLCIIKTLTFSFGSLCVGTAWPAEVWEMLRVCAGAADTVTGIICGSTRQGTVFCFKLFLEQGCWSHL